MTLRMIQTKIALSLMLLIIGSIYLTSADTQGIPDLVGNWTGTYMGHERFGGYQNSSEWLVSIMITDQKGRIFNGTILFQNKTDSQINDPIGFSGAIGSDLKTFYLSEYEDGYAIGTIVNLNTLEYIYAVDGANASVAIDTFTREK